MYRFYRKNELYFALSWIFAYVLVFSLADDLSEFIGIAKLITLPAGVCMAAVLWGFLKKYSLTVKYGLCAFRGKASDYLYFLPMLLILSTNLWNGGKIDAGWTEAVLFIGSMICVGFLEELIFRGLLFRALCRENVKTAILVSSLTFGIGHIVNLFNGSAFLATLLQTVYATAIGFLFTVIAYRGKSLWPCIAVHGAFNSLSLFSWKVPSPTASILSASLLSIVCIAYAAWILKKTEDIEPIT